MIVIILLSVLQLQELQHTVLGVKVSVSMMGRILALIMVTVIFGAGLMMGRGGIVPIRERIILYFFTEGIGEMVRIEIDCEALLLPI